MTIKQKQWQLYFLGYYEGKIDGIWGKMSTAATKEFQGENGLADDGIFGAKTEAKTMEIIKAIQKAVGATVDGLAGAMTTAKTVTYQKNNGLTPNGIADKLTRAKISGADPESSTSSEKNETASGTFWDDIKYFSRSEFRCTCGGKYCNGFPVEPDEQLVRILDKVREKYGKAFSPNSSIRCPKRNAEVGGVSNSQHLYGIAADISVPGVAPKTVAAYLETLLPNTGGIGIYSWGVHVDTRKTKSRWNG